MDGESHKRSMLYLTTAWAFLASFTLTLVISLMLPRYAHAGGPSAIFTAILVDSIPLLLNIAGLLMLIRGSRTGYILICLGLVVFVFTGGVVGQYASGFAIAIFLMFDFFARGEKDAGET